MNKIIKSSLFLDKTMMNRAKNKIQKKQGRR